jgi:hypothetical protein
LSTALGYNLGRSSSCQCLFSFSFEDDLITKIGRLLTAPEFYSFFLYFGAVNLLLFNYLLFFFGCLPRARGKEKKKVEKKRKKKGKDSQALLLGSTG